MPAVNSRVQGAMKPNANRFHFGRARDEGAGRARLVRARGRCPGFLLKAESLLPWVSFSAFNNKLGNACCMHMINTLDVWGPLEPYIMSLAYPINDSCIN